MRRPPEHTSPESGIIRIDLPTEPQIIGAIRNRLLQRQGQEFVRKIINAVEKKEFLRKDFSITQSPDQRYYRIFHPRLSEFLEETPYILDIGAEGDTNTLASFHPWTRYTTVPLFVEHFCDQFLLSIGFFDTAKQQNSWILRPIEYEELAARSIFNIAKDLELLPPQSVSPQGLSSDQFDLIRLDWQLSRDGEWIHIPSISFSSATRRSATTPSRGQTPHRFREFQFAPITEDQIREVLASREGVIYPTYPTDGKATLLRLFKPDPVINAIFYPTFEPQEQQQIFRNEILKQII